MKSSVTKTASTRSFSEERRWRKWSDDVLMHTLSPNIYRTWDESVEAFKMFDKVQFSIHNLLFLVLTERLKKDSTSEPQNDLLDENTWLKHPIDLSNSPQMYCNVQTQTNGAPPR